MFQHDRAKPNLRLRDARRERHWTQEGVVGRLDEVARAEGYPQLSIEPCVISKWETGRLRPAKQHVFLLSKLYGKAAYQLGLEVNEEDNVTIDLSPSALDPVTLNDMRRRSLMLGSAGGTAMAMTTFLNPGHLERVSHLLKNPKAPDEATVSA